MGGGSNFGQGGTQISGGLGFSPDTCLSGVFGLGGASGDSTCAGGGGGWYGGGSGCGAGGGSSNIDGVTNGNTSTGVRAGDGLVELDYVVVVDSDGALFQLYSFFDLRDRDSFVQVTNVDGSPVTIHVQVFDVNNNCNENNFFDVYTGNDTHVYNMSDILRNDGNPSGVLLPADAYGMVVFTVVTGIGGETLENSVLIGNFTILDIAGYEYRTNMLGIRSLVQPVIISDFYFNYNIKGNVTLSDVVGLSLNQNTSGGDVDASPQNTYASFDIDIFNTNEVPFSCRDIIFACIDDDSPLLEQLLEDVGGASVASFEYGINNAIPHSRGGELLCPGNNISDGVVVLRPESTNFETFVGYIGLNSGNGRGSMDSFWEENFLNQDVLEELLPQ